MSSYRGPRDSTGLKVTVPCSAAGLSACSPFKPCMMLWKTEKPVTIMQADNIPQSSLMSSWPTWLYRTIFLKDNLIIFYLVENSHVEKCLVSGICRFVLKL